MRLSRLKDISLERKILRKLNKINKLKSRFSNEDFNINFGELRTIWKIFLLHCIQPHIYLIFDQHVFRAMQCIQSNILTEISTSERQKIFQYESYQAFFDNVVHQSGRDNVKVDRALWCFGKFLKQNLVSKVLGFAG